ncbi:DUF547 domain-containing protein [Deferribacteraceae bacterium V6Fe1]|nr:DUF547 domain-containing protein [Deferribacteraceae bacterium V6Fe1]
MRIIIKIILILLLFLQTSFAAYIHEKFDVILQSYVINGLVDYKSLLNNRKQLDDYLLLLSSIQESEYESWSTDSKLAFLINLYNAATLQLIIDNYPVKSIKDIGNIFSGPWDKKVVNLFGKKISLDNLEHDIIRKTFSEPRIHFALVCAAKGCPPLRYEAYAGEKLDTQLTEQVKGYLQSSYGMVVDYDKKIVYLSSIFKWYNEDFNSIDDFIKKYSSVDINRFSQKWIKYDWSLNEK